MSSIAKTLWSTLSRHRLPVLTVFVCVIGTATLYIAKTPPKYESSARLIVDDRSVNISPLGQNLVERQNKPPGDANPLATQAELVASQQVLDRAIKQLNKTNLSPAVQALNIFDIQGNLKVTIVPATNILEVVYRNSDPKLTALMLNAIADSMIQESVDSIRSEASSARRFLEQAVPQQRALLEQVETQENLYRQESGLVSPERQTEELVKSLSDVEAQQRTLMTQLQGAYTRALSLRDVTDTQSLESAYASVQVGQNATLTSLKAKLLELENQLIVTRSRFTDLHPAVQTLLEQRDNTRALYRQEIQNILTNAPPPEKLATDTLSQTLIANLITEEVERAALEQQLQVIKANRSVLNARLAALPKQQQPLNVLVRKREEAIKTLGLLQAKLEEARIAEAQLVSNIRVTDRPSEPKDSVWPKPVAVLAVAAVAGAVLATGVLLVLELLDGSVRNVKETAEILELPILGVLPKLTRSALNLEPSSDFLDNTDFSQPYEMFLKTLEIRTAKPLHVIVVSSVASEEGKSTVVSHLAAVAGISRRILIISADLRRPKQHQIFNAAPQPGLTDVIEGVTRLEDAVQATAFPFLFLLTHGTSSQHPTSILESSQMRQILMEASIQYDLVIVDTPPISLCAETLSLAQQADALVLVVRPYLTQKEGLRETVTELSNNGLPLVGVVVNGAKRSTLDYPASTQNAVPFEQRMLKQFLWRKADHN